MAACMWSYYFLIFLELRAINLVRCHHTYANPFHTDSIEATKTKKKHTQKFNESESLREHNNSSKNKISLSLILFSFSDGFSLPFLLFGADKYRKNMR